MGRLERLHGEETTMEAAILGALFLLSMLLPAYVADASLIPNSNDPAMVAFGIGGAAGVGALLSLTGAAVWNFLWPITPGGGWVLLLWPFRFIWSKIPQDKRRSLKSPVEALWSRLPKALRRWLPEGPPATFRANNARNLGQYWELAKRNRWSDGDRAVIATSFLLYSEAPAEVREWIRRRYVRFCDALSAVAAIGLGIATSLALFPVSNPARWGLTGAFALVALATFVSAHEGRREAVEMETYWFLVRADPASTPQTVTRVAFEPGTEVAVRPSLWGRRV
jgi:hypothetical protein